MADENKKEMFPPNNYTDYTTIKPKEQIAIRNEQKPRQKRTVQPKIKKQTFGERIANNIKNIDHEQIRESLLFDWLFPEIVNRVGDLLRMVFFGNKNANSGRSVNRRNGVVPYNSMYDGPRKDKGYQESSGQNFLNQSFRHIRIPFNTRDDALYTLSEMRENLEESAEGYVTVKELYSLLNLPTNFTMSKWGWYDLEEADVTRQGEDYILEMPKADVIAR